MFTEIEDYGLKYSFKSIFALHLNYYVRHYKSQFFAFIFRNAIKKVNIIIQVI